MEMRRIRAGQLKDVVNALEERQMLVITFEEEDDEGTRTGCCSDTADKGADTL